MSAPLESVEAIFDGRGSRRADAQQTLHQMGVMERGALGLHSPIADADDGYVKFKMGKRSRWLWVRLNAADAYDLRITRYSSKDMAHFPDWGRDDVYAEDLRRVLTNLRDNY